MKSEGLGSCLLAAALVSAFQPGCFTPVGEGHTPESAEIETLFIAPIDEMGMGTLGARYWWQRTPGDWYDGPAAAIQEGEQGELLVDQLAGALLLDGTFLSPPLEWAQQRGLNHFTDGWHRWQNKLYRTTAGYDSREFTFWRYSTQTQTIAREIMQTSGLDGGPRGTYVRIKPTLTADGGSAWCVGAFEAATIPQDGGLAPGNLRIFNSPNDTHPMAISNSVGGWCEGSATNGDVAIYLIQHRQALWSVVRANNQVISTESLHAVRCIVPRKTDSNKLLFSCQTDRSLQFWQADSSNTRLLKTIDMPEGARLVAYLREDPLLYLQTRQEPKPGTTNALEVCNASSCSDLCAAEGWPVAIGVIDSSMLLADYISDAGVRLRRIPTHIWNLE